MLWFACILPAPAGSWIITFPGTVTIDGGTPITPPPTSAQGSSNITATFTITYTWTGTGTKPTTLSVLETGGAGWQVVTAPGAPAPSGSSSDGLGDPEVDGNYPIGIPATNVVYDGNSGGTWAKQLQASGGVATDKVTLTAALKNGASGTVGFSLSASVQPLAIPINFRLSSCTKDGAGIGTLLFKYAWDSSDGNLQDLKGCYVHEYVTYPRPLGQNYQPDSPPFSALWENYLGNPTITPGQFEDGTPAEQGVIYDRQLYEPSGSNIPLNQLFIRPYKSDGFVGTQYYEYDDVRTDQKDINLFGPLIINDQVVPYNGSFAWKVSKETYTSSPLPLP